MSAPIRCAIASRSCRHRWFDQRRPRSADIEKKSASDAGKKAFITNRVGDWGFILGIFLIFYQFGTLDFRAVQNAAAAMPVESAQWGVLSTIALLLFIGATGKSAQIPLYVWLPDAMEGPTPVSALIHAATMVTAGVYMLGRNAVLFSHAPQVMTIVAVVGVLTAVMAASIGLVQNDIKRVLAYSTVSQLGYMFTAMGVGAFAAGAFHLMTHAFFKALLFLGSGSVIHAMAGEQDMRKMGGLRAYMPKTYATMMIGTLAIAGIPPLAGFFSKDEILFRAFLGNKVVWTLAVITALMTAFYMFRLMSLTFFGEYRGTPWQDAEAGDVAMAARDAHVASDADAAAGHGRGHDAWHGPHESPAAMTMPLMVLALGAVLAGFVGVPAAIGGGNAIEHFLAPSFAASHEGQVRPVGRVGLAGGREGLSGLERQEGREGQEGRHGEEHASTGLELGLMVLSVLIAAAGIGLAWRFYVTRPEISDRLAERFAGVHRVLTNKYYVDELYGKTVIKGTLASGRGLWAVDRLAIDGAVNAASHLAVVSAWFSSLTDRRVVDGLVNLVGWVAQESSFGFRRVQTGLVQNYALLMLLGIFLFVGVYLVVR